jgi:hypothetical protein
MDAGIPLNQFARAVAPRTPHMHLSDFARLCFPQPFLNRQLPQGLPAHRDRLILFQVLDCEGGAEVAVIAPRRRYRLYRGLVGQSPVRAPIAQAVHHRSVSCSPLVRSMPTAPVVSPTFIGSSVQELSTLLL